MPSLRRRAAGWPGISAIAVITALAAMAGTAASAADLPAPGGGALPAPPVAWRVERHLLLPGHETAYVSSTRAARLASPGGAAPRELRATLILSNDRRGTRAYLTLDDDRGGVYAFACEADGRCPLALRFDDGDPVTMTTCMDDEIFRPAITFDASRPLVEGMLSARRLRIQLPVLADHPRIPHATAQYLLPFEFEVAGLAMTWRHRKDVCDSDAEGRPGRPDR